MLLSHVTVADPDSIDALTISLATLVDSSRLYPNELDDSSRLYPYDRYIAERYSSVSFNLLTKCLLSTHNGVFSLKILFDVV